MKTEIIAILDKSTSMRHLTKETIQGFNSFIKEQKKVEGECNVTAVLFSGSGMFGGEESPIEVLYTAMPVASVPEMTIYQYNCGGWTALLDAIGITVDQAGHRFAYMKEEDRPTKVIVLIITDGEENSSKKYDNEKIKAMIKHQEDVYHWEFMFLGANQDAFSVAGNLGMKLPNVANYSATCAGTESAYRGFAAKTTMLRNGFSANAVQLSSLVTTE